MEKTYTQYSTVPYFYLGVEFYLLGRIAFHKQLITSSAVLFHHAIERLLLAALVNGKTKKYLKQRYKDHKLDRYWKDFKSNMNFPEKHELDDVIKRLNNAVDLRFVSLETNSIVFMPSRESVSKMSSYESGGKKEKYGYVIVLEDVDLFFNKMVDFLKINSLLVHQLMATSDRMDDYLKDNNHIVFDPKRTVPSQIKIFRES